MAKKQESTQPSAEDLFGESKPPAGNVSPPGSNPPQVDVDKDGIPYCIKHHCRMQQKSGAAPGKPAYYKCPVEGCDAVLRMIRTKYERIVPAKPTTCPRCQSGEKREVFCERSERMSDASMTVLACPECGLRLPPMVRPELEAFRLAQADRPKRPPAEEIGAR